MVVPIVCRHARIPSIVGLIVTGIAIGPHGFGLLERDAVIDAFSQIGILYIMFLSGIEIDMDDFRQERKRGFLFGVLTFLLPLLLGFIAYKVVGMSWWSSLLAASILGSHTLMTYTAVSRYGIHKNPAVSISIGATIVAVTSAMIILGLVSSQFHGTGGWQFVLRLIGGSIIMTCVIFGIIPRLLKWCFHRTNDAIQQWLLAMTMAVIGGVLANLSGLEPILGVFLTALAINRLIPNQSPLMNRINFAGNALFVPIFLLGVGMLIDVRVFVTGWQTALVAIIMLVVAISAKWLAALLAQKAFKMSKHQRRLLFGLTNSHAAGALAAVMIGYGIVLPSGEHLLSESILNATIILILISCTISSFVTERAAEALHEEAKRLDDSKEDDVMTLLPAVRTRDNRKPKDLVTVLQESRNKIPPEDRVKHIIMNFPDSPKGYEGPAEALLRVHGQAVWMCHFKQALTSFTSVRVLMPEHADTDPGYRIWQQFVEKLVEQMKADVSMEVVSQWAVLPRIQSSMAENELLLLVQARPQTPAYNPDLEDVPDILREHFLERSFVVLFPAQSPAPADANALIKEVGEEQSFSFIRRLREKFNK